MLRVELRDRWARVGNDPELVSRLGKSIADRLVDDVIVLWTEDANKDVVR